MEFRKININLVIIIVYFVLSISFLAYQHYRSAEIIARADREIQRQKEYSETLKDSATPEPQEEVQISAAVAGEGYQENVPSTDLFLKAAQAEKGEQQQVQPQVLDYGSQVAAYEAQVKAKEQQAGARQAAGTPQTYTAPVQQRPQQAGAVKSPTSLIQPEKQQETKLNKLETRRIFK